MNELNLPLPEGAQEAIEQAKAAALQGQPGELTFQVQIKRADGTVEDHTLTGRVDGTA